MNLQLVAVAFRTINVMLMKFATPIGNHVESHVDETGIFFRIYSFERKELFKNLLKSRPENFNPINITSLGVFANVIMK